MRWFARPEPGPVAPGGPVARLVADPASLLGTRATAPAGAGPLLAPGLRILMSRFAGSATVADLGAEWATQGPTAVDALRRLPLPRHRELTSEVHTFVADDVLGASRLLILDELLAALLHVERPSHGVLVIAPNRHLLAVHVLTRLDAVAPALQLMSELALVEHRLAGPVSPWVYYRDVDARLGLLTPSVDPASPARLDPGFGRALEDLGRRGG